MDTTPLRDAYRGLLDAAATVAEPGATSPVPPAGEWNADQILAHVAVVTAATIAAASTVASAANTTYDNRLAQDTWTLERVISQAGGNGGLRERIRLQGDILCAFGGPVLSEAELDTPVPTLLLSHDAVLVDQPLPLRDIITGLAEVELPGHTQQLLALLPAGAEAEPVSTPMVRPAVTADVPAIATIWHDGWRDGHLGNVPDALVAVRTPESFWTRAAARVADTTVAVDANGVAGFVMVVGDEVEQVYVAADRRGTGVAGILLSEAERLVAGNGHERAWLAVAPGNERARRFYERSGWIDDGPFTYAASTSNGTVDVPVHRYVKYPLLPDRGRQSLASDGS